MFAIGFAGIGCPLIFAIEALDKPFRKQSFQIAYEDDVVFAMEINPTAIAMLRIEALCLLRLFTIEDFVKSLRMDIS